MIRSFIGTDIYCTGSNRRYRQAVEFGQDGVGGFGPDERFGAGIVFGEIGVKTTFGDTARTANDPRLPKRRFAAVI
jgi:hypothetical protein